jgi:hypothetical protein
MLIKTIPHFLTSAVSSPNFSLIRSPVHLFDRHQYALYPGAPPCRHCLGSYVTYCP